MGSDQSSEAALSEAVQASLSGISEKLKPINILLIEKAQKIYPLNKLHVILICLILAILGCIPEYPQIIQGMASDPYLNRFLLIGDVTIQFLGLLLTLILFSIARESLLLIIKLADTPDMIPDLALWAGKFTRCAQLRFAVVFALVIVVLNTGITLVLNEHNLLNLVGGMLWAAIGALIWGNLMHFYFKCSTIAPRILGHPIHIHSLLPAETRLLRCLVSMTLQLELVVGVVFAFILSQYYLRTTIPGQVREVGVGVILAFALMAWGVMVIPLTITLRAVTTAIRKEKEKTLTRLQTLIDQTYQQLASGNLQQPLKDLDDLFKLYNSVKGSPDFPISLGSAARLLAGFILPLLPALINRLFNL